MKANIKIALVASIIANVKTYGKLFVTTNGQMFRSESSCKETVRSLNAITDEYSLAVGYVEMTKETFTPDFMIEIGKDVDKFNALFDNAVIPRQWDGQREQFERQFEKPNNEAAPAMDEVAELLGIGKKKEAVKAAEEKTATKTVTPKEPTLAPKTDTAANKDVDVAKAANAIKEKLGLK